MSFLGNDPEQLEQLANRLTGSAADLDEVRVRMGAALHHGPWTGPDAERMRGDWDATCVRVLLSAADALRHAAATARSNAEQQIDTSRADGATSAEPGRGSWAHTLREVSDKVLAGAEAALGLHDTAQWGFWGKTGMDFEELLSGAKGLSVLGDLERHIPKAGITLSSIDLVVDALHHNGYDMADDGMGIAVSALAMVAAPEVALPALGVYGAANVLFGKDAVGRVIVDDIKLQVDEDKAILYGGKAIIDAGIGLLDGGKSFAASGEDLIDGGKALVDGGKAVLDGGKALFDGGKHFISSAEHVFERSLDAVNTFEVKPMEAGASEAVNLGSKIFHRIF